MYSVWTNVNVIPRPWESKILVDLDLDLVDATDATGEGRVARHPTPVRDSVL